MVTVFEGNICKNPVEMFRTVPQDMLKRNLEQLAPKKGFDIEVAIESFKLGNGFLADGGTGVVIYHKQYKKKYHSLVLEQKTAYGQAFLYIHYGGKSSNSMSIAMSKTSYSILGGELHEHRPGILGKMMAAGAQKGLQDEELYYDRIYTLIGEAIRLGYDMLENPHVYASQAPAPKAAPAPQPKAAPAPKAAPTSKAVPTPKPAAAPKAASVPTPPPAPKAAPIPQPTYAASEPDFGDYPAPEKIAEKPFCYFNSVEKRLLNFGALQDLHPEIYAQLMYNPLYQKNTAIVKTNLQEISQTIREYLKEKEDAKELVASLYPGGNPQQLDDTLRALERNKKSYPIKKGTNALLLCIPVTMLGGCRGYFVTPDYFADQKLSFDVEWTPLEEIQTIDLGDNGITINGKAFTQKSFTARQIQYDVLVYAIGMALAMKYPFPGKKPEKEPAMPKAAPAPQPKAVPAPLPKAAPAPQPKATPAPQPKAAPVKPAAKPAFTAEKIADYPFAQPGYLMKRALNFTALKAMHPQIYNALMINPIFKLHPDIKSANFRTLSSLFAEYCDEVELSEFAPEVAEDSDLTDLFLYILRITNKTAFFAQDVVPFLTYRRADLKDTCDTFCVTPDHLLIFTHSPHVTDWVALEDIQSIAVQNDAIIVNGITYPLRRPFAPLQEKYDSLVFFIGMILAMKYPAEIPADDKPVVFEPQIVSKPAAPKPAPKAEPKPASKVELKPVPKVEPKPAPKVEPKPAPKTEPKPVKEEPKAPADDPTDAALDKIMKAKQMLDAGVITEEEFATIKKRILSQL